MRCFIFCQPPQSSSKAGRQLPLTLLFLINGWQFYPDVLLTLIYGLLASRLTLPLIQLFSELLTAFFATTPPSSLCCNIIILPPSEKILRPVWR